MNVYLLSTILFIIFDMIWIYFFMNDKYKVMVSSIQDGENMETNSDS